MRLSTSTNIYFNRPDGSKAAITDSIARCARAGYRVMDMNFHDCCTFRNEFVTEGYEAWLEEVARCAREWGVSFSQAHAPFYNFCDGGFDRREEMDELIRRSVRCAARLGIPWLVIHAGTDFAAADWRKKSLEKNLRYFRPLLDYAAGEGVGLAIENLWDLNIAPRRRYTAQPEELLELVDRLDSPMAGVCCDVEHAAIMGQDPAAVLRLLGGKLRATHISDFINIDSDHLLPFNGRVQWAPVMEALREVGYAGDFTYEIHRYTATLPDALAQDALAYSVKVGEYLLSL